VSIEQIYCYFTDLLLNKDTKGTSKVSDGANNEEQAPSTKNLRLLTNIRHNYIIDIGDFYDEILGISTKEMTMSENVSIPDVNKRKLCNVELLTNKR
jgi:hypothetical protein